MKAVLQRLVLYNYACPVFEVCKRATLHENKRLVMFKLMNWEAATLLRRKLPFQLSKIVHKAHILIWTENYFTLDDSCITVTQSQFNRQLSHQFFNYDG